jgi:hypothetical protein
MSGVAFPFAVGGGLVAWAAHLAASYLLLDLACPPSGEPATVGPLVPVALTVMTVAFGAAALVAAALALRLERHATAWRRSLVRGGLLLDVLAFATILLAATPLLIAAPCARAVG